MYRNIHAVCNYISMKSGMYTHTVTYTHIHMYACLHAQTHNERTHTHIHTHMYACRSAHICVHIEIRKMVNIDRFLCLVSQGTGGIEKGGWGGGLRDNVGKYRM